MMNYNDIEIQGMKEILKDKEKEIERLNMKIKRLEEELDLLKKQQLFSLWLDEDDNRKAKRPR